LALPDKPKKPRCKALDSNYDQQKKSRKQEDRVAKGVGGRRQPGSGALPNPAFKGDVRHDSFLVETKRTDAKSISVKAAWLIKIEAEARMLDKIPALSIEIGGLAPLVEKDWCLMPMSVFNRLVNRGNE
jgi:hypothetical protein